MGRIAKGKYEWKKCLGCNKLKYIIPNRRTCSTICSKKYHRVGEYIRTGRYYQSKYGGVYSVNLPQ